MDKSRKLPHPAELVAGIRGAQLSEILDAAKARRIAAGQIILREGASPTHLFLLKSGRAKLYRLARSGDEVLLSLLTPGDSFGLGSLLARPVSYIGTAETTRDCELLVWEQARIRRLARKYPRLAENALGIVLRYWQRISIVCSISWRLRPRSGWCTQSFIWARKPVQSLPLDSKSARPTKNLRPTRMSARLR